jgi:hypothetical protein
LSSLHLIYLIGGPRFATAELPHRLKEGLVFLVLRTLQTIIPVTIPMGKYIRIPNLFDLVFIIISAVKGLFLLSKILAFLN